MGTDVHGVFQRLDESTGVWTDIESLYEQQRHYQLFAALAGVRNGTGFAGVATGEAVQPIADQRGLPDDFAVNEDGYHAVADVAYIDPKRRSWRREDDPLEIWIGDHSHSWLTGEEMLAWQPPEVWKCGVMSRAEYEKWDGKTRPESYSGDVMGQLVARIEDNEADKESHPDWTHIRCQWQQDLKTELAYFFDEVSRLVAEHGKVRFVFGFDS